MSLTEEGSGKVQGNLLVTDKLCKVCGDRALGYNFNAITCESCKAFFRRNALKTKEFTCPFSNSCSVDVITRRFCQKCRLNKCFTIGMKKEWIMSEEEKKLKKAKIEENKGRKTKPSQARSATNKRAVSSVDSPLSSPCSSSFQLNESPSEKESLGFLMESFPLPKAKRSKRVRAPLEDSSDNSNSHFSSLRENKQSQPSPLNNWSSEEIHRKSKDYNLNKSASSHLLVVKEEPNSLFAPSADLTAEEEEDDEECRNKFFTQAIRQEAGNSESSDYEGGEANNMERALVCSSTSALGNKKSSGSLITDLFQATSPGNSLPPYSSLPTPSPQTPEDNTGLYSNSRASSPVEHSPERVLGSTSPLPSTSAGVRHCQRVISQDVIDMAVVAEMTPNILTFGCKKQNLPLPANQLSPLETMKIDELISANEVLNVPAVCEAKDPKLLEVINMTNMAIRRLIKMSKKIEGFKNLCQEDQIALLKGGCIELMILRSAMTYDAEKNCWAALQASTCKSIKVDVLKEASGNLYEEHKRFIMSFEPLWRCNETIMLLLSAITLFSPDRPNLIHRDSVRMEQSLYYFLLRRYLDTHHPSTNSKSKTGCQSRVTYLRLLQKLRELQDLNENHIRILLDVNPNDVEPLLIEIFDMKHLIKS